MVNECLETGDFLLMEKKSTIQDIAAMAGVSKSTVSRYLNNGYVSREKAAKISEIIDQTGFQSNFFAKRLKTKHSKLIGVVSIGDLVKAVISEQGEQIEQLQRYIAG